MHVMFHDVFSMHDLPLDKGGSQMGVTIEVVHEGC